MFGTSIGRAKLGMLLVSASELMHKKGKLPSIHLPAAAWWLSWPQKVKSRQLLPDYNLFLTPLVSVLGSTVVLEREISPLFNSFTTDCISSDFIKIFQHMLER